MLYEVITRSETEIIGNEQDVALPGQAGDKGESRIGIGLGRCLGMGSIGTILKTNQRIGALFRRNAQQARCNFGISLKGGGVGNFVDRNAALNAFRQI